jgi:hypothetical protein
MDVDITAKRPTWLHKDEPDWKMAEELAGALKKAGHTANLHDVKRKKYKHDTGENPKQNRLFGLAIALGFVGCLAFIALLTYAAYNLLRTGLFYNVYIFVIGTGAGLAGVVICIISMVIYYKWLKPVWPYLKARNHHDRPLMLIVQKNGPAFFDVGKYVAEVFEYLNLQNPMAFFKNDRENHRFGQADLDIFYEATAVAHNMEFVIAIEELTKRGYKDINGVMSDYRQGKFKDDPLMIPILKEVDVAAVIDFVQGKPGTLKTYCDTKINIDRLGKDQKFWDNPQLMAIGYVLICGGLAIGIMKSMNVF